MNVRRWMSSPPITTYPDMPVYLAHRKMVENDIRRLPVVSGDDQIVGIISERDARTVMLPEEITTRDQKIFPTDDPDFVKQVMTRSVLVVHPEVGIREAVRIMHDHKISGLPVVENGRCVGVITVHDTLEVLMAALDSQINEVNREIQTRTDRGPRGCKRTT